MASAKGSVPAVQAIRQNHGYHNEEQMPTSCDDGLLDNLSMNGGLDEKPIQHAETYVNAGSVIKHKRRRQEDSTIATACAWVVRHQIGLAANLLLLLALTHASFPRARRQTRKFFKISYANPSTGRYALGWDDLFMVFYWIVVFTGLRAAVMNYILVPLALRGGIKKKKDKIRFAEQAWMFLYSGTFWSFGMTKYLMCTSKYWLNLPEMWTDWPDREMDGAAKWYYLVQFALWLQQILVVNIEERRKDYAQMFSHHIVTCALILASYGYHQTRVGNTILCLFDLVDIILPFAKMLKYLKYQVACDVAFGVFMVVWFISRHILYSFVWYSLYADAPREIQHGCYWGSNAHLQGPIPTPKDLDHWTQPFRDPEGLVCWDRKVEWAFLGLLLALQVILLIWFGMIMRVAVKVIKGGEAEDSRSDDEAEAEEQIEKVMFQAGEPDHGRGHFIGSPLEEEVGVEAINLNGSRNSLGRKSRKGGGTASGVALHSDRKELLGRIGCDKGL